MDNSSAIIGRVKDRLKGIGGIDAIALGGSRARGTDTPGSDIDIGLYYGSAELLDMPALQLATRDLDDGHREGLVAPPGDRPGPAPGPATGPGIAPVVRRPHRPSAGSRWRARRRWPR